MLKKQCSSCLEELPASSEYFHKQKMGLYGFRSTCKKCRSKNIKHYTEEETLKHRGEYKVCSLCNKQKPTATDFHKDPKSKDGLVARCKSCVRLRSVRYYNENKEKVRVSNQVNYQKNKEKRDEANRKWIEENKDRHSKYQKQYRIENEDKLKRYKKAYYQNNKLDIMQKVKLWSADNPDKVYITNLRYRKKNKVKYRLYDQKRRALESGSINTLSEADWNEVMGYFDKSCAYCGDNAEVLHQEHVIPLSKGGAYNKQNIIPSCPSCNCRKWTHEMETWYRDQDFYDEIKLKKIHKWMGLKDNIQQLTLL